MLMGHDARLDMSGRTLLAAGLASLQPTAVGCANASSAAAARIIVTHRHDDSVAHVRPPVDAPAAVPRTPFPLL